MTMIDVNTQNKKLPKKDGRLLRKVNGTKMDIKMNRKMISAPFISFVNRKTSLKTNGCKHFSINYSNSYRKIITDEIV